MPLRERSTGSSPPASPTTPLKRHEENGANKGFTYIRTYLGHGNLVGFGHFREFFGKLCGYPPFFNLGSKPPKVSSYSLSFFFFSFSFYSPVKEKVRFGYPGYPSALLVPLPCVPTMLLGHPTSAR